MLPVAILAGGLATRLRPVTDTVPKALVEINGEPFLAHQLRLLKRSGLERIVLCTGYRGEQIQEFAGDGRAFSLHVEYSPDGPQLLGTAGAIRRALPLLGESFFVLYGDSYLPCDYAAVEHSFLDNPGGRTPRSARPLRTPPSPRGLMTVHANGGRWDSSNVEFVDGQILAYDKTNRTPAMRHIDYGLGAFHRDAFADVPEDRPSDLAAVYQKLLRRGELAAYEVPTRFYEIGSPEGIRELAELLSR